MLKSNFILSKRNIPVDSVDKNFSSMDDNICSENLNYHAHKQLSGTWFKQNPTQN